MRHAYAYAPRFAWCLQRSPSHTAFSSCVSYLLRQPIEYALPREELQSIYQSINSVSNLLKQSVDVSIDQSLN